jgi:hypothetical protein
MQQLPQTTPPKAQPFVFRALAARLAVVRGVGCDDEGLDDDDDDDGDGDKTPNFDASMGAIMTAGVRRLRAATLAAIAFLLNGVQPARLHASISHLQLVPSTDVVVLLPSALCLLLGSALTRISLSLGDIIWR